MADVQGLHWSVVNKMMRGGCICTFPDAKNADGTTMRILGGEVVFRRKPAMGCPIDHLDDDVLPEPPPAAPFSGAEFIDRWREWQVDAAMAHGCRCFYRILDPKYNYPDGERAFRREWPEGGCPVEHDGEPALPPRYPPSHRDDAVPPAATACGTAPTTAPASLGVEALLAERAGTHGDFAEVARVAQASKAHFRPSDWEPDLAPPMVEAFDMIATKLARICCGNPREADHWRDVAGYATLMADIITREQMDAALVDAGGAA